MDIVIENQKKEIVGMSSPFLDSTSRSHRQHPVPSSENEKAFEATRRIGLLKETTTDVIDASIRHMHVVACYGRVQAMEEGGRVVFVAARKRYYFR